MYAQQFRAQPPGGASSQGSYDAALSFLKQLNSQELQSLMDDNDRLNRLVDDLEMVKKLEQEKDTLLASNKSIAEYNLTLEPRLIQSRQQLAETYEQAVQIQKGFERNKLKLDSCTSNTSLDTTLALLQMEAAKAEEESEKVAEAFLSHTADVDKFLNDYTELRKTAHLRKVKTEKLEEIVKEQTHPMSSQNSFTGPTPSRAAPVAPYPMGGVQSSRPPYPAAAPNHWAPQMPPYPANGAFPMPNPTSYLPR